MTSALTTVPPAMPGTGQLLTVEAERAVRVLMRKSPATQRTYQGIYERFAAWLAAPKGVGGGAGGCVHQRGVRLLSR